MIVDASILLYSADLTSSFHEPARTWLEEALNGRTRVGLPWASLLAFVRVRTSPRVYAKPLSPREAWTCVEEWVAAPAAWIATPTEDQAALLGELIVETGTAGSLVADAHIAALAMEYGVPVVSADSDFARFRSVTWIDPIAQRHV